MNWLVGVLVAILAFVVGYFLIIHQLEDIEPYKRMAEAAEENREKFREKNMTAFVLGASGEVGKELVKELLTSKVFRRLVLIGRRELKFEDELYKDVEQKVVNFEKIEDHADAFEGLNVGFCCLGTTRGKAGAQGFYRVDHDYVVNSAKVALGKSCKHFHMVSSTGANRHSSMLYQKTKGEVEAELTDLGFERLVIYRPAILMCDRQESRPMEKVARVLLRPIAWGFPTLMTVPTSTVAKAMVNTAVTPSEEKVTLMTNKMIHEVSGDLKK